MLFVASKLLQAVTQPMFWLALLWVCALVWLGWARRPMQRRMAMGLLRLDLVLWGLLGFKAGPEAFLRPLENRY